MSKNKKSFEKTAEAANGAEMLFWLPGKGKEVENDDALRAQVRCEIGLWFVCDIAPRKLGRFWNMEQTQCIVKTCETRDGKRPALVHGLCKKHYNIECYTRKMAEQRLCARMQSGHMRSKIAR